MVTIMSCTGYTKCFIYHTLFSQIDLLKLFLNHHQLIISNRHLKSKLMNIIVINAYDITLKCNTVTFGVKSLSAHIFITRVVVIVSGS